MPKIPRACLDVQINQLFEGAVAEATGGERRLLAVMGSGSTPMSPFEPGGGDGRILSVSRAVSRVRSTRRYAVREEAA